MQENVLPDKINALEAEGRRIADKMGFADQDFYIERSFYEAMNSVSIASGDDRIYAQYPFSKKGSASTSFIQCLLDLLHRCRWRKLRSDMLNLAKGNLERTLCHYDANPMGSWSYHALKNKKPWITLQGSSFKDSITTVQYNQLLSINLNPPIYVEDDKIILKTVVPKVLIGKGLMSFGDLISLPSSGNEKADQDLKNSYIMLMENGPSSTEINFITTGFNRPVVDHEDCRIWRYLRMNGPSLWYQNSEEEWFNENLTVDQYNKILDTSGYLATQR